MNEDVDPAGELLVATVSAIFDTHIVTYPKTGCGDLQTSDRIICKIADWEGPVLPLCGQVVQLMGTAYYAQGWRALSARAMVSHTVES